MSKVPIVAVSYLNTKPFLHGLQSSPINDFLDIKLATPTDCATALKSEKAAIGLVPIALLADVPELAIVSNYCIGALGAVRTVSLFSTVPLAEISRIYLDYQSRTSAALTQVLAQYHWKITPEFVATTAGYEQRTLSNTEAALVIGDRAIAWKNVYPYEYDLAAAWQDWQKLPFVFAAWVALPNKIEAIKAAQPDFFNQFDAALAAGLAAAPALADLYQPQYTAYKFDVLRYFQQDIQYNLDSDKRRAAAIFIDFLRLKW
jgi:chorismate dehydratase